MIDRASKIKPHLDYRNFLRRGERFHTIHGGELESERKRLMMWKIGAAHHDVDRLMQPPRLAFVVVGCAHTAKLLHSLVLPLWLPTLATRS